jgi:hypothetical protein
MLKKDYKARVAANQFDLDTLPICGARTRSGGLCKHKGNIRNGRCKRHGGESTGPTSQALFVHCKHPFQKLDHIQ